MIDNILKRDYSKKPFKLEKITNAILQAMLSENMGDLEEATKISSKASDDYFDSRPMESKIGAWASKQSEYLQDRKDLETESRPLDKALWDGVVDTVGGKILAKAISHTRPNGIVAACGLAADYKLHTTVMPFIIRGVKLWGIDSVMISMKRREFIWSQVSNLIDFKFLEKYTTLVNLEELLNIFPNILKGEISGRVLVDLNK